jgi:aryl-alcohol dehydrogenase
VLAAVHLTGATAAVVDVNLARLELATRLGAAHVVNARDQDTVEALKEFSGGRGIDRTLEATGVPAVLRQAIDVPRHSIPALVALHRQRRFPFDELIRVYDFADIQQAADDAAAGTVVKPVLRMPRDTP